MKWQMAPLHFAVIKNDILMVIMLLTGFPVNVNLEVTTIESGGYMDSFRTKRGKPLCNAIRLAVLLGHEEMVEVLLKYKVDVWQRDHNPKANDIMNSLEAAFCEKNANIVHNILQYQLPLLPERSRFSLESVVRHIVGQPWYLTHAAVHLYPNIIASDLKEGNIVKMLIDGAANPDLAFRNVQYLLQHGYDVNKKMGFYLDSFLHLAASSGATVLVDLFLSHGLSAVYANKRKETPLHHLVLFGNNKALV